MVEWEMIFTISLVAITLIVNKIIDAMSAKKMREQITKISEREEKLEQTNAETTRKINELHEAHMGPAAYDEDGAFKWWFKKSFEESIHELNGSIRALTDLLKEWRLETKMRHQFEEQHKDQQNRNG